jgi:GNAT superfamily N-acetyltransferase
VLTVAIRPAQPAELSSILALYTELETGETNAADLRSTADIFARIQRVPRYTVYVALAAGEILGVFSLLIMENLAHGGAPSGIVEDVVVHPRWRRQGVGRQMLEFAMQECRQANCYKLMLSSNLQRKAAHRFYQALGFQQHGYSFVVRLKSQAVVGPTSDSKHT